MSSLLSSVVVTAAAAPPPETSLSAEVADIVSSCSSSSNCIGTGAISTSLGSNDKRFFFAAVACKISSRMSLSATFVCWIVLAGRPRFFFSPSAFSGVSAVSTLATFFSFFSFFSFTGFGTTDATSVLAGRPRFFSTGSSIHSGIWTPRFSAASSASSLVMFILVSTSR